MGLITTKNIHYHMSIIPDNSRVYIDNGLTYSQLTIGGTKRFMHKNDYFVCNVSAYNTKTKTTRFQISNVVENTRQSKLTPYIKYWIDSSDCRQTDLGVAYDDRNLKEYDGVNCDIIIKVIKDGPPLYRDWNGNDDVSTAGGSFVLKKGEMFGVVERCNYNHYGMINNKGNQTDTRYKIRTSELRPELNGLWISLEGIEIIKDLKPTTNITKREHATVGQKAQSEVKVYKSEAVLMANAEDNMTLNLSNAELMDERRRKIYEMYNIDYDLNSGITPLSNIPLQRMNFVHGMPFEYTGLTDRRLNSKTGGDEEGTSDLYGRIFAKEIVSNMPIVTFVPGIPKFLTSIQFGIGQSKESNGKIKDSWMPIFVSSSANEEAAWKKMLDSIGSNSKLDYFSLSVDTEEYYKNVNTLCRISAKNLGIGNMKYYKATCETVDWGNYMTSVDSGSNNLEEVTGLNGGVSFAYEPQSSVSDTINNSTGESQLAGLIKQQSAKAREIQFIAGAGAATELTNMSDEYTESVAPKYSSMDQSNVWNRLKTLTHTAVSGENIRFPEIWNDSQYSKSYDLEMKFIAPYATKFCKWRYVLVPFFHIFALASPRSDTTVNSYKSPFLIKAFSKGYFNCEMGIIESLTYRRFGDGNMISENGVATEIDISVAFKDLYLALSMSAWDMSAGSFSLFFNNSGLMDLVGTLSGVNMNRTGLGERLSLYAFATSTVFSSAGSNFMRHFSDRTRNWLDRFGGIK